MSKLNCGVYKIENLIDGKMYIGGSADLKKRKYNQFNTLKCNKNTNPSFQEAYNLHGEENFELVILLYCEPFERKRYEQFFVNKYKKLGLLYNVCLDDVDSRLGVFHSPETCAKMSKNHADVSGKNNPMYGSRRCGDLNPFYGKTHSPESIEKMKESKRGEIHPMYGKHYSPEAIEKRSGKNNPLYGTHPSPRTIEKMRKNCNNKGKNNPMYGKTHTEKTRDLIRKSRLIPKEKVLKIFSYLEKNMSAKDIAKKLNISKNTVYRVKNGRYNKVYNIQRKK